MTRAKRSHVQNEPNLTSRSGLPQQSTPLHPTGLWRTGLSRAGTLPRPALPRPRFALRRGAAEVRREPRCTASRRASRHCITAMARQAFRIPHSSPPSPAAHLLDRSLELLRIHCAVLVTCYVDRCSKWSQKFGARGQISFGASSPKEIRTKRRKKDEKNHEEGRPPGCKEAPSCSHR